MTDLVLHHFPAACSQVAVCALEMAGLRYRLELVDITKGRQTSPEYLAQSPLGKVPLLTIDGVPLSENAAILTYVAAVAPDAEIFPVDATPRGRAEAVGGLSFCGGTLHPIVRGLANPARLTTGDGDGVREQSRYLAAKSFGYAEQRLAERHWWLATALAGIMLAAVAAVLPEPLVGLLARPREDTLARVNAFLANCRQPVLSSLPPHAAPRERSFAALLSPAVRATTLRIALVYFLYVMSVFYIQSWVPTLVVGAGFSPAQAAGASVVLNLGGIAGGLLLGLLVPLIGLRRVVVAALLLTAAGIVLFGIVAPTLLALQAMAAIAGVATIGGMTNLYAIVSRSFPPAARASGTGLVIGIGRFGSALGPALAGILLAHGFVRAEVSWALALPAIAAATILAFSTLADHGRA